MSKKGYNLRLDTRVMDNVEAVANAAGMDRNDYVALWLGRIANLKLDCGLDALTSIPKDFFKSHGGRPAARTVGTNESTRFDPDNAIERTPSVPVIQR